MYLDEFVNYGVWDKDAVVLMERYFDVTAVSTRYGRTTRPEHASRGRRRAGRPTRSGRSSGGVGGRQRSHRQHQHEHRLVGRRELQLAATPNFTESGHDATVVSVDMKKLKVYLNDSAVSWAEHGSSARRIPQRLKSRPVITA